MDLSKISNSSQISSQGDIQSPNLQRIIDFLTVQSTQSNGLAKSQDQKLVGILDQLLDHEKQRFLYIKTNKQSYNYEEPFKKSKISDSQFKNSQHFYNKLSKQKNLNSPSTFYYLGELFKTLQNQQTAERCYRKSIQIDENFIEGYHSLGLLLKNQKKYEQAEKFMLKVLELRPVSKSGHYNLALVYQKMKKYELSFQYFAKTIQMDPKFIEAYQGIGLTLYQAKKYPEAKIYIEKGLAIDPKSEICQSLLQDVQKALNRIKKKQHKQQKQQKDSGAKSKIQTPKDKEIQKNEKEFPKDDPITDLLIQQIYLKFLTQQKQNSNEFDEIMLFGELCQMEGNYIQAEKKYRKALGIKPDEAGPYLNLARVLIKQEKYTEIEKPLQKAVQLNPELEGALNMLSLIYLAQNKKLDIAQKLITKLLTIKPNFIEYESMLAQCYIKNKKYKEAKSLLEKIEKYQANNIKVLLCLVEIYQWEKKQNEAYITCRKAFQIDPKDLDVFNKLYSLQFSKRDFLKCEKLLRDIIQVYPNQPTHYYNLGLCLGRQQKYELAYNYSGKALQMKPGHPLYLVKHSQILFKLNRLKDALLSLGKAKITLSSSKPDVLMTQYRLTVGNLVYMIDTLSLVEQIQELLKKEQKMNSQQKQRFSTLTKSYFQSIISTGETQKKYDLKQKQLSTIRASFISMSSEIMDESESKSSEETQKYKLKQKQLSYIRQNMSFMSSQITDNGNKKKQEKGPLIVQEKQIKMPKPKQIPLKIISATLNESKATLGKMDPYCKITYGSQIDSTNVAKNGHLNPFWEKQFKFKRQKNPTEIIFQVFEKSLIRADKLLGQAKITDEQNSLKNAKFLDLNFEGKKVGWITLAFYYQ